MSARKPKKPTIRTEAHQRAIFNAVNQQFYDVRISTPLYRILERLNSDAKFRAQVVRLMAK